MEDAHIALPNFVSDLSVFAIMDGHGGSEVAQYTKQYLPPIIKASPYISTRKWKELLATAFHIHDEEIAKDPA